MGHRCMSLFGACLVFRMVSLQCLRELSEQLTVSEASARGSRKRRDCATSCLALLSIQAVYRAETSI